MAMTDQKKSSVELVTIDEGYQDQRIDNFLRNRFKSVPKSVLYRIIRKGEVRVNKKRIKPVYKLQIGDVVRVPPVKYEEKATPTISKGLKIVNQLEDCILFEDKDIILINKPAGMAVHGGSGLNFGLIEALRSLRPDDRNLELVHRLDRDTSGCLLIAKKRSMLRLLHEQLREKTMQKNYWALVDGQWDAKLRKVDEPLNKNTLQSGERVVRVDKKEGKPSQTLFRVLERFGSSTLVQASPVTGRTHQIRVHTACKGHPIACDDKYGNNDFGKYMNSLGLKRMFLHAFSLKFEHPGTKETMYLEAPLDKPLNNALETLKRLREA
jgi:23S rRNA pseudouridine955/2504/2580 synthase